MLAQPLSQLADVHKFILKYYIRNYIYDHVT